MEFLAILFFTIIIFLISRENNFNLFINTGKALMTEYTISKLIKEVETLNFYVYTSIDNYDETYVIWRSNNDMPYVHGAYAYDIYITDKEYSKDYKNNGHCKVYDMFKLEEEWIYINSYILQQVKEQVTNLQFEHLISKIYRQAALSVLGYTILQSHKKSTTYAQIEFKTKFDKMDYDLRFCNSDVYNEIKCHIPKNIKSLINNTLKDK